MLVEYGREAARNAEENRPNTDYRELVCKSEHNLEFRITAQSFCSTV